MLDIVSNLKGIFLPIVTPFNRWGGLDERSFLDNVECYAGAGLSGIVVAGSTGEAPYLSESERLRLVELARDAVQPPQLLVAGVGLESTRATLELGREAARRGADVLLVITPAYFKPRMDAAALSAHYRSVADGVQRPVEIYSIPQFTGVRMEARTIAQLARHPNIVGLKESSGDLKYLRAILRRVQPGFRVLVGSAAILLEGLRAGAAGGVLGPAGFVPEICVGLYEAFRRGDSRTARELQRRLTPLVQKINQPYGVAGVKAALDFTGYAGGAPRSPLRPLDREARQAVARAIKEARAGLEF